jgi:hypothetical protein
MVRRRRCRCITRGLCSCDVTPAAPLAVVEILVATLMVLGLAVAAGIDVIGR